MRYDHIPHRFAYGDFLFPSRLLKESGADENPLVTYSRRRAGRRGRRILLFCYQLGLLAISGYVLFVILVMIYSPPGRSIDDYVGRKVFHREEWEFGAGFEADAIRINITGTVFGKGAANYAVAKKPWFILLSHVWVRDRLTGFPYVLLALSFLLLRYHLFRNDQSHHMKSVTQENLSHLLTTRITGEEYYLHHLLLFCQQYGPLVGFFAVFGIVAAWTFQLPDGYWWVVPEGYGPFVFFLNLVLACWAAGALQYVLEWRLFAGGRWLGGRFWLSLVLSIPLTLAAMYTARGAFVLSDEVSPSVALILYTPIVFLIIAWSVFKTGQRIGAIALPTLVRRFESGRPGAR